MYYVTCPQTHHTNTATKANLQVYIVPPLRSRVVFDVHHARLVFPFKFGSTICSLVNVSEKPTITEKTSRFHKRISVLYSVLIISGARGGAGQDVYPANNLIGLLSRTAVELGERKRNEGSDRVQLL